MTPKKQYYIRPDLNIIANLIDTNSSVLDLGCGKGELLSKLINEKKVQGHGVEIYDDYVFECAGKGVPVIHSDLDEGLGDYPDKSFDYVILSQTLQQVKRPHVILREMLRVGKIGIVSLINFGYWWVRHYLFFHGEMPKSRALPYEWYDTPNIHLSTIKDFRTLCMKNNFYIKKQINLTHKKKGLILPTLFPNSFAELAIFVLEK